MEREEIEGAESIQKWRTSLIANSRKGVLSDKDWYGLINLMRNYLEFTGSGPDPEMTPDKLRDEGLRDPDEARSHVMRWYNWLQGGAVEGYTPWMTPDKEGASKPHKISQNTAVTYVGRLRGFYSHNKVMFGKWRMPNRETGDARRADSRLGVYKYDEENGELYVDTPLLQQFLGNLSFRDQGIALALYSTSQDPADLFQLTIGWMKEQENERRLFWEGNRAKTGEPFKTFFSRESTGVVRRYVAQERVGAGEDEPIWVKDRAYSYEFNGGTVEVGGAMETPALNDSFRNAALSMGVTEEGKPNPLRSKRFRHLFRTACTSAGLDPGLAQAFMGHKTPISSKYLSQGKGFLLSQYVLIEPFLTVLKSVDQTDIQDIKATLNKANKERDAAKAKITVLEERTRDLDGDLRGTEAKLKEEVELSKARWENTVKTLETFETVINRYAQVRVIKDKLILEHGTEALFKALKEQGLDPETWTEIEERKEPEKATT